MTINFFEPGEVPKPRDQVKITQFYGIVLDDLQRVQVTLHVTPFLERPNIAVALVKDRQRMVGEMSIIETMHNKMEFTLHMRGIDSAVGDYILKARLYYEKNLDTLGDGDQLVPEIFDQAEFPFSIEADLPAMPDESTHEDADHDH